MLYGILSYAGNILLITGFFSLWKEKKGLEWIDEI